MNDLVAATHPYLVQYGYTVLLAVLFTESFGLPLPGETFLIGATLLAINGQLGIAAMAGWAIAAVILGDNVGYLIGRWGRQHWTIRHGRPIGIIPARLEAMQGFFDRFGPAAVMVARFFPVLRQLNGICAGSTRMPWRKFAVYNALGGMLWVGAWTSSIYLLGDRIERCLMQGTCSRLVAGGASDCCRCMADLS